MNVVQKSPARWACILGLVIGAAVGGLWMIEGSVALEPKEMDLAEPVLEPQVVKVDLRLRNRRSRPIVVLSAVGSCGCMNLRTAGDRPLTEPITVTAGSDLPWSVEILTANRVGRQRYSVTVEYQDGGGVRTLESLISLDVRASWRAEPYELVLRDLEPGRTVDREIGVFDAFPEPGIKIDKVICSSPRQLTAEVLEVGRDRSSEHDSLSFGRGAVLKKRYRLRVRLTPVEIVQQAEERITLVSNGSEGRQLEVPIVFSTVERPYELVPKSIVFRQGEKGPAAIRRVLCKLGKGANPGLRVASAPSYIKVGIVESEDPTRRWIDVELTGATGGGGRSDRIVFSAGEHSKPVVELPVHIF